MRWKKRRSFAALCFLACSVWASGQEFSRQQLADFFETHFAKHEYRVAMRDGVKLYTVVYTPIASQFAESGPYPFLMTRTPYSCGNYDNRVIAPRVTTNMNMLVQGYILVCQDVRGRWESEGTWQEMTPSVSGPETGGKGVDESTDMYDSVDWLLKNVPGNNGRVGILGISYPGFYTAASIVNGHPAIKAASPQAPIIDLWMGDDAYHGGAFMLDANHSFYAPFFAPQRNPLKAEPRNNFAFGTKDMYAYYLKMGTLARLDSAEGGTNAYFHDQVAHSTYDSYWQIRNLEPHLHGVKAAVMAVGGWFDAEDLAGPVKVFHSVAKLSPEAPDTLVEGPWVHGGWARGSGSQLGDITFGNAPSAFYREQIEAPFFAHYLKNAAWTPLPKAYVFETGRNVWRKYDAWPPKQAEARTLYFAAAGGLSWKVPRERDSKDEYVSDPAHPVPFTPYVAEADVPQRYMDDDQRFATRRGDVLVYETEPLKEDLTVVGPVKPRLKIASTGTDSDFDVKLIDVFPEDYVDPNAAEDQGKHVTASVPVFLQGYQMLVRGEPMRAKFRNSWEHPEPLVPGKVTSVDFTMQDVNHTFLKGHRIMVQVQSSWFPLTDRNPQVFEDIAKAKPQDFVKATETVFHQADAVSAIELLVMPN
jgi:putative CocE/NonD family hydrolase